MPGVRVIVWLALLAVVAQANASAERVINGQLPTSVAPPPAGNGGSSSSASGPGPGAVDRAAHGYGEEELIVSGMANVYR